jgi:DNA-binding beta-propeller fold protein YncE
MVVYRDVNMTTKTIFTPTFRYSHTVGNQATPPAHGFTAPTGVAIGPNKLLYVVSDYYEFNQVGKFVVKCTIDEDYLGAFGSYGSQETQFTWPNSLAVDQEGNVYVSDEWLQHIAVFDPDGRFQHKWGTVGDGDGQWNRPAGLAFDSSGNLLVVDSLNHRIQRYTRAGRFLDQWGGPGSDEGQLNMPWGIAVDRQDNVYVADWRNDRIQKFTPNGRFLMAVGRSGSADGEFNRPSSVVVDRDGYIYVVDWGNDRVQVFDPQGSFVTKLLGDCHGYSRWAEERMASNPENMREQRQLVKDFTAERRFFMPTGITLDPQDRVIISDTGRHRLQIYQKISS